MQSLHGIWLAALAATTAPWAQAAPTSFHPTPGIATLHVTGARDAVRSLQANFQVAALPRPVRDATVFRYANYYIAAAFPDGRMYSYTRTGWIPVTLETLTPFDGTRAANYVLPPETFAPDVDVATLAGAQIYAGIEIDDRKMYFTALGEVPAPRAATPVSFPHAVGAWTVERSTDAGTGAVRCQARTQASAGGGHQLTAVLGKTGATEAFAWTLSLTPEAGGPAVAAANIDTSLVRINDQPALSLRQWSIMSAPADGTARTSAYGAIEPLTTSAMGGGTLNVRFASAGGLQVDQAFPLDGFDQVVDALDHCATTQ